MLKSSKSSQTPDPLFDRVYSPPSGKVTPRQRLVAISERPALPDVLKFESFLSPEECQTYMDRLMAELSFRSAEFQIGDRLIRTKRQSSFHSDSDISYEYALQAGSGKPWTPTLLELRSRVETKLEQTFNAVLCNYYINGDAGMGWHSDKEKVLGDQPVIASLSLGQSRDFAFRPRDLYIRGELASEVCRHRLDSGTLLVMQGLTQDFFEHTLLKNKHILGSRLNLTFRKAIA